MMNPSDILIRRISYEAAKIHLASPGSKQCEFALKMIFTMKALLQENQIITEKIDYSVVYNSCDTSQQNKFLSHTIPLQGRWRGV